MQQQRRPTAIRKTQAPQLVCGLAVESVVEHGRHDPMDIPLVGGKAQITWSYRDHNRWTPVRTLELDDCRDLFKYLREFPANIGRPYIVAPRAHDALTLCGFWEQIESKKLTVRLPNIRKQKNPKPRYHPLVMRGCPDIIGWSDDVRRYRAVSIDNLCKISLHDAAINLGMEKQIPKGGSGPNDDPTWPLPLQSEVCLKWYQWLIDWWVKNECGQWGDTIGLAAWNTFRCKGVPSILKTHDYPAITYLESQSCFGGRAAVYFGGSIGASDRWEECANPPAFPWDKPQILEPVSRFDVRSMYPTIMRDALFPVKCIYREKNIPVDKLWSIIDGGLAVAAVRIKSRRGEIPRTHNGAVQYPGGVFDTTLSTPELRDCIIRGEVLKCHAMAQYQPGNPFKKWGDWILNARSVQKGESNVAGQVLMKSLANALSGRMARKGKVWRTVDGIEAPLPWGAWKQEHPEHPDGIHYRSLGGVVQELQEEITRCGLLAACYSHLTSYGRLRMALTREMLGPRSVVWQDTDGILVRRSKVNQMQMTGGLDTGAYGTFRKEGTVHCAYMYSPKAHWMDGEWTVAGIHNMWQPDDTLTATERLTINPARTAKDPGPGRITGHIRRIDLKDLRQGQLFDDDGWLKPKSTMMHESDPIDLKAVPEIFAD